MLLTPLRALPDVDFAATAANGAAAVAAARRVDCNVVLLDMAIEAGMQTAAALISLAPTSASLRSACGRADVVGVAARRVGIRLPEAGLSDSSPRCELDDLAAALRSAVRGEAPCSGKIAAGLIRHIALNARSHRHTYGTDMLTRREREVLRLLETDMSNEIGQRPDSRRHEVRWHHARRLHRDRPGHQRFREIARHRSDYVPWSKTSNASTA